jgi:hypothetical protein
MNLDTTASSWGNFIDNLTALSPSKPVLRDCLSKMDASPDIYWYPGSGTDLSPLILDVPNNPTGERLYRINDSDSDRKKPILLWMNDYSSHQPTFPRPGPMGIHYSRGSAALKWEYFGDDKWRGWSRYDTKIEVSHHQERYLFRNQIAITLFTVTVRNQHQGPHTRPAHGDRYLVVYSNCASHELLQHVLLPYALRPRCVALIRQGGFSGQLHYEQYIDLPSWLSERSSELGGPVDLYVIDAYGQDLHFKRPLCGAIAHYDYRGGPVPWGWPPCRAFGRPGLNYRREHKHKP